MLIPTPAQQEIRDTRELDLLIVAPAGCGKTEALALRVAGLIDRGQVARPHRVLVTTFSNRARDNIRERLEAYLKPGTMRDLLTVANFHGLAARIFRAHGRVIGLDPMMTLPESDWVADMCRQRKLTYKRSAMVQGLLQKTKQQALDDQAVDGVLEATGDDIAIEIERQRVAEGRLTYDDLPRVADLILQHEGVASLYRSHFACVIVDEFQDLTPQQLRIVNRIGLGRTTYAGDLAQGIYGFAGADPELVERAIRAECSQIKAFAESHRSSPAVLDLVNALAARTGGVALTSAEPTKWVDGGLAGIVSFQSTADEAAWAFGFARYVLEQAPASRIALIARTAPRRRFVDDAVNSASLPCYRWDDGVLDTETAKLMRNLLSRLNLAACLGSDDPVAYLRDEAGVAAIQEAATRTALLDALGWCSDLLRDGHAPDEISKRIRVGDGDTLLTMPGVHLLTGHVGKGQQFDWVVILGAEEGCIPDFRADTPAEIAEEARVFSVMISRARHGVVIANSAAVETRDGMRRPKSRSQFIADFSQVANMRIGDAVVEWVKAADWRQIAAS